MNRVLSGFTANALINAQFVNVATGVDSGIGHDLESCTSEILVVKMSFPEFSDYNIVFVDTPGFDDTKRSDTEILRMIANWLATTCVRIFGK